jgi:hypothetical protein
LGSWYSPKKLRERSRNVRCSAVRAWDGLQAVVRKLSSAIAKTNSRENNLRDACNLKQLDFTSGFIKVFPPGNPVRKGSGEEGGAGYNAFHG